MPTSLAHTGSVMCALVMKMWSTPNEVPMQGMRPLAAFAKNMPTSSSQRPPAAIEPTPMEPSLERPASGSSAPSLGARCLSFPFLPSSADLAGGAEGSVHLVDDTGVVVEAASEREVEREHGHRLEGLEVVDE